MLNATLASFSITSPTSATPSQPATCASRAAKTACSRGRLSCAAAARAGLWPDAVQAPTKREGQGTCCSGRGLRQAAAAWRTVRRASPLATISSSSPAADIPVAHSRGTRWGRLQQCAVCSWGACNASGLSSSKLQRPRSTQSSMHASGKSPGTCGFQQGAKTLSAQSWPTKRLFRSPRTVRLPMGPVVGPAGEQLGQGTRSPRCCSALVSLLDWRGAALCASIEGNLQFVASPCPPGAAAGDRWLLAPAAGAPSGGGYSLQHAPTGRFLAVTNGRLALSTSPELLQLFMDMERRELVPAGLAVPICSYRGLNPADAPVATEAEAGMQCRYALGGSQCAFNARLSPLCLHCTPQLLQPSWIPLDWPTACRRRPHLCRQGVPAVGCRRRCAGWPPAPGPRPRQQAVQAGGGGAAAAQPARLAAALRAAL